MKIAQIINSIGVGGIGGAEKLLVESIPLYQKKAIEMDLITLRDDNNAMLCEFQKVTNGRIIGLTSKSIYNPILIFKIIPLLRRYDLVHIHLFPSLYWVVLAKVFSGSKTKLVYTEHNTYNRRRNSFIFKFFDRVFYRKLSKVVTIAEEVDYELKKHLLFNHKNFCLIHNGINVHSFHEAIPYPKTDFFSNEDIILIQISSFRGQKDQNTLLRSIALLPQNVKLLLVGVGPMQADSELLVSKLQISDRVKFLGIRNDIAQLLKTADIVVLSSKNEGLSLSSIEGMAAQKPFIASAVPGLREIVQGHGILFEQGNADELAQIILDLIRNPEYRNLIAEKCYERAKEFDIGKMVDGYIEVYKNVLKDCSSY